MSCLCGCSSGTRADRRESAYRRPSEVGESYSVAAQAEVLARMDGLLEALVAAGVGAATA
jgi:hypothetical protein